MKANPKSSGQQAQPDAPDTFHARQVEAMAGYGIPADAIARVLGIDPHILRRDYPDELENGSTKANARVAESLFRKATGDGREGVIAAIFWMKTRAGWRETTRHEVSGIPGRPYAHMSLPELDARIKVLMDKMETEAPGTIEALTSRHPDDS